MMPGDADEVPPELTEDAFLGGRLRILQPRTGYRAGVDAVLLAAAVPAASRPAPRILDIGAGVGTAGLCVARRIVEARVTLIEREPHLATIAGENIRRNGLADRLCVVPGDVLKSAAESGRFGLSNEAFEHVLANPPFHEIRQGTQSADRSKAASHAMPGDDLDQWARAMARYAAGGGTATVIHKADKLSALLDALGGRFGSLKILPIHPRMGAPAIRVIVQGIKGSKGPLTLLPGFILHGEASAFTPAAEAVLRDGAALDL